jgi:hypothetical protein
MPSKIKSKEYSISTIITRSAIVAPASLNEKDRSMSVTASTEVPVRRVLGGEIVDEVLSIKGWEITPDMKVPLLNCHSYFSTSDIRGSAIEFTNDIELACKIVFSSTAENDFTLAREGHLDSVSVGYDVREYYYVKAGETIIIEGRSYTAGAERAMIIGTKIKLIELSLVPVPADEFAKIRNLDHAVRMAYNKEAGKEVNKDIIKTNNTTQGVRIMDEETVKTVATEVKPVVNETEIRAAALEEGAELATKRISEITLSCRELGLSDEFTGKLISDGTELPEARAMIIREAGKNHKSVNPDVRMGADSVDKSNEGLTIIAKRALGSITKEEQASISKSELNGIRGPVGIAKAILESHGVRTAYMSNDQVYSAIRQQGIADFTYITSSAGNAVMESVYEENLTTVDAWTDEKDLSNFNAVNDFDVTPLPLMPTIADKAVVTEVTLGEYAESVQLDTKGYVASISRQAFINDTFGVFSSLPTMLAERSAQTVESAVYTKLAANPVLKDTKALFHVDHGNLGAGLLTSANLSLAKAVLLKMVSNSQKIGAPAKFLIVPADMEDTAKKLVYSAADVGSQNDFNPHATLQVVATPYLSDVNDWYLAGSKGKTIVRAYLNGQRTPTLTVDEARGTEALGFFFRVIFDLGIGVRSPFYLYKSVNAT